MRHHALTLTAVVVALAVLAPAAHTKDLHANVVSLQSQLTPGEPVPLVFELYVLEGSDRYRVARSIEPVVVLVGSQETRRFPAARLGSGRYAAEIVFPTGGDWKLRVAVGDAALIQLGKGAVRIDDASSDLRSRLPELPLMLAGAALLAFLHVRTRRS